MEFAVPVDGDGVEVLECADEVLGMLSANVLDSKVINAEAKIEVSFVVFPKSRCAGGRVITVCGKVCLEADVS